MIQTIYISNYAIIDKLELSLSKGFNVITGETGAGKSILLGALGLIMGDRADTKVLFDKTKKSIIEATFDISAYELKDFFESHDLDYEKELIIRREISNKGNSRVFVNDTPTKLNVLKELGSSLIDMHRQFDMLDIHNRSFQVEMLDAVASNTKLVSTYQQDYKQNQQDKRTLAKLKEEQAASLSEMDFLKFQLNELHEVELDPDLVKSDELKLNSSSNAEDIKRICYAAYDQLSEQELSLINQLTEISNSIQQIYKYDPNIENIYDRLESSIEEIRDISSSLRNQADNTDYNPEEIETLQEKLDAIYKLQTKHRVSDIESLIMLQSDLETKLKSSNNLNTDIVDLENKLLKSHKSLMTQAEKISKNRLSSKQGFEKSIMKALANLSMIHAQFNIKIEKNETLNEYGIDDINYLFSANKGHDLQDLKEVASGGEISRLTLCIKSLIANSMSFPTLIFDEIDAGVSGDVANKMALMLKELAENHQIINITHSPQIASKGDQHYFIYKEVVEGHTKTKMRTLKQEERITEIATMLSGNPPSTMAIENAKDLLK